MFGSSFSTGGFLVSVGSAVSSGIANPNLVPDKTPLLECGSYCIG